MTARRVLPGSSVREHDKFMLRLPGDMRDRIKAGAEENGRSMNAEIIRRLKWSFGHDDEEAAMLTFHQAESEAGDSRALPGDPEDLGVQLADALSKANDRALRAFMKKHGLEFQQPSQIQKAKPKRSHRGKS